MSTLVDFAETKDAVSFKSAFEQSLAAKVSDALETKKYEVVQKYFNGATVEESAEQVDEEGGSLKVKSVHKMPPPPAKGASKLPKTKER
jgi:hypothetical protein